MFAARHVAGLALALISLAAPAAAQQVEDIDLDTATLGDVIRVFGSELGNKPKLVLVEDGELVKKTKLKVVGSGDTGEEGGGPYVDVTLQKGVPGTFSIGVKLKKDIVGASEDTLELVVPTIELVNPDSAEVKDEVVLMVRDYGSVGGHKVFVGSKKAKITNEELVEDMGEGAPGVLTAVTFKVPKVPAGNWPVSVQNRLGTGILKGALEISGGVADSLDLGKPQAMIEFIGKKTFKAKKKIVTSEDLANPGLGDPGQTNVGGFAGSKKAPITFGVHLPSDIAGLEAGDSFTNLVDEDDAQILYVEQHKNGTQCTWASATNDQVGAEPIEVQVVAIDEDVMVLFVCGTLRFAEEVSDGDCSGPALLSFSGIVIAPAFEQEVVVNGPCTGGTTASMSTSGSFVSGPNQNEAIEGISGPGTLKFVSGTDDSGGGPPDFVISFTVTFDPDSSPTPMTFDGLEIPAGTGLSEFTLLEGNGAAWSHQFDEMLNSSMSVTITNVMKAPGSAAPITHCVQGSFTGTVSKGIGPTQETQTITGQFEIPVFDFGGFGAK